MVQASGACSWPSRPRKSWLAIAPCWNVCHSCRSSVSGSTALSGLPMLYDSTSRAADTSPSRAFWISCRTIACRSSSVTASSSACRSAAVLRANGLPGPPLLPAVNRPRGSRPSLSPGLPRKDRFALSRPCERPLVLLREEGPTWLHSLSLFGRCRVDEKGSWLPPLKRDLLGRPEQTYPSSMINPGSLLRGHFPLPALAGIECSERAASVTARASVPSWTWCRPCPP